MDGVGLVSCHRFNGTISPLSSEGSIYNASNEPCSPTPNAGAHSGNLSDCAEVEKNKPVCSPYDEDFDVNGDEEVSTPRSSPTLLELRKLLDDLKPTKNSRFHDRKEPVKTNSNFLLRSLKEVVSRPCQHPLEKFYDEAIPVRSLQRSVMKNNRLNSDKPTLPEQASISTRSLVSHPPVRRLDSILTCPTSPLPRLSSYCSSSGSLIGNLNGIPMSEKNLFLSDDLFPPNLSKSLYMESGQSTSNSNGYMDELHLDSPYDKRKSETDHLGIDHDSSEDSGLYTPSDDASSPGTASCTEKENKHAGLSPPCFDPSTTSEGDNMPLTLAPVSTSVHLPAPTPHLSHPTPKSKHSKRSKASSPRPKPEEPVAKSPSSDQLVNHITSSSDVDRAAPDLSTNAPASTKRLLPVPPDICSTVIAHFTLDSKKSVIECSGAPLETGVNVSNRTSRSASTSSRTHEDPSVDGDFTLVTNKKNRRKQKLEQQQQERQAHPSSPTISGPIPSVCNTHVYRPPLSARSQSGTLSRGSFRKPWVNGSTSYHRFTGTNLDPKQTSSTSQPTVARKSVLYKAACHSNNTSDGASISGQSDRSLDSHASQKQQQRTNTQPANSGNPTSSSAQPTHHPTSLSVNENRCDNAMESPFIRTPISSRQHQTLTHFLLSSWTSFANQIAVS